MTCSATALAFAAPGLGDPATRLVVVRYRARTARPPTAGMVQVFPVTMTSTPR